MYLFIVPLRAPALKLGGPALLTVGAKVARIPDIDASQTSVHQRKRDKHESQDIPLKGNRTAKFMEKVSEEVTLEV